MRYEKVSGKKAAIIGGGPTGIAAAYFLARAGIETTIFERESCLGGVPRHVIPSFRIANETIEKDIALITNTINIFQPDILCIGGGVCNEGDPLLVPMKEIVKKEVYTRDSAKNTEIVIAQLGNDAGIIGAAFLGNAHD